MFGEEERRVPCHRGKPTIGPAGWNLMESKTFQSGKRSGILRIALLVAAVVGLLLLLGTGDSEQPPDPVTADDTGEPNDDSKGESPLGRAVAVESTAEPDPDERDSLGVDPEQNTAPSSSERAPQDDPESIVVVHGSDVMISRWSAGSVALRFPLLRPTEERGRQFFVYGANEGQEPRLLIAHEHRTTDPADWPLVIDPVFLEPYDHVLVTTPEWESEPARIVVSILREPRSKRLVCPEDSPSPCSLADDTEVGEDGFLTRQWGSLEPGESRRVPREHFGSISLPGVASDQ